MKKQEQVLLYRFTEAEKLAQVQKVLHSLNISVHVLPEEAWREKVGYLLGIKGFKPVSSQDEDDFVFPHEIMVLHNIRNKRLDQVLKALQDAGVSKIKFKAVVTPFNTLWTFRRLCETMQKEHGAMMKMKKEAE